MGAQFASQSAKLGGAFLQNGVSHATGVAKSRDDAANRGDLHLGRRISDKVRFAISSWPLHRHPSLVDGNARALPFQGFETLRFQETVKACFCGAAMLADHPHCRTLRRL